MDGFEPPTSPLRVLSPLSYILWFLILAKIIKLAIAISLQKDRGSVLGMYHSCQIPIFYIAPSVTVPFTASEMIYYHISVTSASFTILTIFI